MQAVDSCEIEAQILVLRFGDQMNSISEFDNGLDDLDDCWDDRSIDSDESFDYSSGTIKKAKISTVKAKKVIPVKKNTKAAVSADKQKAKSAVSEKPDFKLTAPKVIPAKPTAPKVIPAKPTAKPVAATKSDDDELAAENTGESSFPLDQFDLTESTVLLLKERGIDSLFPIQAETYWPIRQGKDLIGRARTGQGNCCLLRE